jgi:hypothetical protein
MVVEIVEDPDRLDKLHTTVRGVVETPEVDAEEKLQTGNCDTGG